MWGLFTLQPIERGDYIMDYIGEVDMINNKKYKEGVPH